MLRENERRKIKIENLGSWDNGDIMHRIVGVKTVPPHSQVLCKCEWEKRITGLYPNLSWVPMESIKEREPYILLQYYEFIQKMFGSHGWFYPLYFTEEIIKSLIKEFPEKNIKPWDQVVQPYYVKPIEEEESSYIEELENDATRDEYSKKRTRKIAAPPMLAQRRKVFSEDEEDADDEFNAVRRRTTRRSSRQVAETSREIRKSKRGK